ncbi:adenylosuccinate lyase [Arenibacter sp. H213]|uniref:Adenylosuccinate lyase n=1 Tax=Arenibacter antarcticus TaxID=2040469 RepID=A0ABW5VKU0_9FLAO|nr:adenylosuccinate lyase [Arenibacter sp. H213]
MTVPEMYNALDNVDASKQKRMEMSTLVLNHPENIAPLIEIGFHIDDPISCKACLVLEFIVAQRLELLLPYLDKFIKNMARVHLDSAVRPIAKICEYLTHSYFINKDHATIEALNEGHLTQLTTTCFDWLIGDQKVAAKAYSMTSLLLLGKKFPWIWPELKLILEQNYHTGSAAYQARARITIAKLG